MKLLIILGTRPEIIKLSPIIRECQKRKIDFKIVHTNQHYSYDLDMVFFEELNLPLPNYNLNVGSHSHGKQTGSIIEMAEKVIFEEKPEIVLVQGDTNTALGGALAAVKIQYPIAHIEAGLRSYDRNMPEEINRVLVDHCSDYLFCPTEMSKNNLLREGINSKFIHVVGNTIVDSVLQNMMIVNNNVIFNNINILDNKYILMTLHRQENVDNPQRLNGILDGIKIISEKFDKPILFPIHPRTEKNIKQMGLQHKLENLSNLKLLKPLGYLDFLKLQKNALLVLTDSGGVQEECCILKTPCVTLRENTERPETLQTKANILAGYNPENIVECVKKMLNASKNWDNPFGDGKSSERIITVLKS